MRTPPISLCVFSLLLPLASSCKGDKPEADTKEVQAPAELVKERVISSEYPAETWATLSLVQPGPWLNDLVEQASPGYDWQAKVEAKAPGLLGGFDLTAPMDALAGTVPKQANGHRVVFAFGIKDRESLKRSLAAMKLDPSEEGGTMTWSKGDSHCEHPAGSTRARCWVGERADHENYFAALDKRKLEGAPRLVLTLEASHLRGPLKQDLDAGVAAARLIGPQAFEAIKDAQLRGEAEAALSDLLDESLAVLNDTQRVEMTLGLQPDHAGVYGRVRLRLRSRDSQLGKWLSPAVLPSGAVPEALFAMPADVDRATYAYGAKDDGGAGSRLAKRVESLAVGAARELGLPEKELEEAFAALRELGQSPWTVTVEPRVPADQFDLDKVISSTRAQHVLALFPKQGVDPFKAVDALAAYAGNAEVQAKLKALVGQAGGMKLPTFESEDLKGVGTRARRYKFHWELSDQLAQAADTPKVLDFVVLIAQDERFNYSGFGTNEAVLMDYLKRTMAGEGPTLGDDPRTAFLRTEQAWSASYAPVDPLYIAEFVSGLLDQVEPLLGGDEKLGQMLPVLRARLPELVTKWGKLPPSAARSRLVVDDEGLVWEGSTPSTTLRMVGDGINLAWSAANEQNG